MGQSIYVLLHEKYGSLALEENKFWGWWGGGGFSDSLNWELDIDSQQLWNVRGDSGITLRCFSTDQPQCPRAKLVACMIANGVSKARFAYADETIGLLCETSTLGHWGWLGWETTKSGIGVTSYSSCELCVIMSLAMSNKFPPKRLSKLQYMFNKFQLHCVVSNTLRVLTNTLNEHSHRGVTGKQQTFTYSPVSNKVHV